MNKTQNIYDNEEFFKGYSELRDNPDSANNTEEKPALFSLLPSLEGKSILDLGCGFGENCEQFVKMGAACVIGADISENMLAAAQKKHPAATYVRGDMSELSFIRDNGTVPQKYDVIVSSLALHYIEDFDKLASQTHSLLNDGGYFIFSQEHPLTTAPLGGSSWEKNGDTATHYRLSDYGRTGQRKVTWFVNGVIKYHRTFSDTVNALIENGFVIEKMLEPMPSESAADTSPDLAKRLHKPNFLLIKARKA